MICTENQYKIIKPIKLHKKVYVIFLLKILMKLKRNLLYKNEHENKMIFFSINKLKLN